MSAPNVEQVVPFLWVRDIQASLRFYVAGLGFVKTKQWVDEGTLRWCWLELGSAAVMLSRSPSSAVTRSPSTATSGRGA